MFDVGESSRRVVFHADDFGMNPFVSQGIVSAFRDGLLTSTSLLANAPAAESALQSWPTLTSAYLQRTMPSSDTRQKLEKSASPFDLGVHLNLTQGRPLTGQSYPGSLLDQNGNFPGIGTLFFRLRRATGEQLQAVDRELKAQIEWMCDRGIRPTHLNGHQYIEMIPQIATMIPGLLHRYAIPMVRVAWERGLSRNVLLRGDIRGWCLAVIKRHYARSFRRRMIREKVSFAHQFFGTAHAGCIDANLVVEFLKQSHASPLTEIGVHPATASSSEVSESDPWFDPLAALRPQELEWLCGNRLPEELDRRGICLGRLHNA